MFSSYAIQGVPLDARRQPRQSDLDVIAADWIEALGDPMSHYFTDIEQNGQTIATLSANNVGSLWNAAQGRLTLTFDLPLQTSAQPRAGSISVRVADPTFFVAYEFDREQLSQASRLPEGCTTEYIPARQLDPVTASRLASIPSSQTEPPPELLAITRTLQHRIELSCSPS
ncbi:DUF1007 domain-containing protein [Orrella marina]|uniref:DUF1007 domain-containing protein n=1 Tax=Orrella marina TaxID=2163011 RepID=A0A2R4XLC9_9BURK|nr:DUF1007 domain-containing protein [Orrella marina]